MEASSSPRSWNQLSDDKWCAPCVASNGTCVDRKCLCPGSSTPVNTDCTGSTCIGKLCSTAAKVAALGVPSVIVVALIAVMILYFLRRRKRILARIVPKGSSRIVSSLLSSERVQSLSAHFGPIFSKEFSLQELVHATSSFSDDRLIGGGGFGAVYEGRLKDGRKVAVKRLHHEHCRRMELFFNEVRILSSLDHPNLVKLYGFCCESERDLLLVFEYLTNGTVSYHLHNGNGERLPWSFRLNIALETAKALTFLHNFVTPPILHRDVKSTNILLDENLHAKLADFGLSRLVPLEASHISTAPQGTPGYVDPDYHQCYQLTDKSDVYSFGVVLMELVTAKLAVDMSRQRREINLSELAVTKILSGTWHELVDPCLEMHSNPDVEGMIKRVVELAFRCLAQEKDERPNMRDVAEELARIKDSGCGLSNFHRQTSIDIDHSMATTESFPFVKRAGGYCPTSVQSPLPNSSKT